MKTGQYCLVLALWSCLVLPARAQIDSPYKGTYEYPEQPGLAELTKSDQKAELLSDGKSGPTGEFGVWGQWDVKNFIVDWTFEERLKFNRMEVVINHPTLDSEASHPHKVALYIGTEDGEFPTKPDIVLDIPFEAGAVQTATVEFPPDAVVAKRLRTEFLTDQHQIALSEVRFDATPAGDQSMNASASAKVPVPMVFLPAPAPAAGVLKKAPFFGVCGHALHTDFFFTGRDKEGKPANPVFSPYWREEYIVPLIAGLKVDWVRETLYQPFFSDDGTGDKPNHRTAKENREHLEKYLSAYNNAGISVLLCPMYGKADDPGLPSFAQWVGELARKYPCVRGVELFNEPNLKGFWSGTPAEFVAASDEVTRIVRTIAPDVPIVAGSFSGWGAAWEHPDLKELVQGPKEISSLWAEKVFQQGLLKNATGLSAHPYRGASAPEGGDVKEERLDPDGFEKEIKTYLATAQKFTPGNKVLPLYLTEIGYSVSEEQGYSKVPNEARQADYLSRMMTLLLDIRLRGVPIEGVFWYDLKQDEIDYVYEANFGLVSKDTARLRPGYMIYRRIAESFPEVEKIQPGGCAAVFSTQADKMKSFVWQQSGTGEIFVGFWRLNQLQKVDQDFASEVEIALPAGFRLGRIELTDLHEDRPRAVGYRVDAAGKVHVPIWVTARAAWLTLWPEKA